MVDLYCESFGKVPQRITLDIDDPFDAVHGGQQLRLFNAHVACPRARPEGRIRLSADCRVRRRGTLRRRRASSRQTAERRRDQALLAPAAARDPRSLAPHRDLGWRADSHYCGPEVLDGCRANGLDTILGVAPTATLRRRVTDLEASTKARFEAAPRDGKLRRFKEFFDGAQSWTRVERIIARVEVGEEGSDARFVVATLQKRKARALYEDLYCRRGRAENHIKSWKTHGAADRTSCNEGDGQSVPSLPPRGRSLADGGLRLSTPKRSMGRLAQFDTLRLRLIKIAARVVEMKTMIRVHLPNSCPAQDILRFALERIPRLVT